MDCKLSIMLCSKSPDKETFKPERAVYNQNRGRSSQSEIQELRSQIQELQQGTVISQNQPPTDSVSVSQRSQVSQILTNKSIMGGRNEQAQNRQAQHAGAFVTQRHVRASIQTVRAWTDPFANTTAENECDTNADTSCLDKNFIVLTATFCTGTADIYAYDTSIKSIENVPIVSAATAYDDPVTGDTCILVFNESLYYGERFDHLLINPHRLRSYGIPFWDNPFDPDHSLCIEVHHDLHIPL